MSLYKLLDWIDVNKMVDSWSWNYIEINENKNTIYFLENNLDKVNWLNLS